MTVGSQPAVQEVQEVQERRVRFSDGSSTELRLIPADESGGRVVLCLPAMGVSATYYEILGDTLADAGFNVAMVDYRGAGGSSVRPSRHVSFGYAEILELELPAIVDEVCAEFGIDQLIIVGHSLGGQLGLLFAASSPRVSQVVLIASGSVWYRTVPGMGSVSRFFGLHLMFATAAVWGYLPQWFPFAGREARRVTFDFVFEGLTGRYRVSRSRVDYERMLAESTTPTLFVVFPDDPLMPAAGSNHLAAKLVRAKVERRKIGPQQFRLARTDHFRWALRPQAIADAMTEWLESEKRNGS